ncbi:MAG TPA: integrase core domain-containing protein, partial [Candidatus Chromulinivoraceae bacterium]|nr:integrase core domain-containing protein [Candidatus Chromulinivoraceae bacterium]
AAEELGSVSAACKHYGIARSEYYYWHSRWVASNKQLVSLYNQPTTPKSHKNDMDTETVSLVIQLRLALGYGEAKLAVVLQRDYDVVVSRHGIGNVLRRAELTTPKPKHRRIQRRLSDRVYVPGEVGQLDVKHWKRAAYQYDIVDCATRIKYKRLYPGVNPAYTVDFLEHAARFFAPAFAFAEIQTDNGLEFVYDALPQTKPDTLTPMQRWLQEKGIRHGRIPPRSPQLNGRIERSHGVDKDRYKKLTTNSHDKAELQAFCIEDCLDYNFYRPHSMLRMLTPVEYLQGIPGYENATLDIGVLYV